MIHDTRIIRNTKIHKMWFT
jgi:putative transposase